MVIAHATDLSGHDTPAFVHAAALCAASGARLVTVYADLGSEVPPPDAGELAARWGRPIDHEFHRVVCEDDVAEAVIAGLRAVRPTLVVVGTHARHGVAAVMHASISEAIARNVDVPVLFVPNKARWLVDERDGRLAVRHVLVPVRGVAEARSGIEAARGLLAMIGAPGATIELFHVGPADPALDTFGVGVTRATGSLEEAIVSASGARDACLVVMVTRGHDGVGDVVLGSHTERVIRDAATGVLSVPL